MEQEGFPRFKCLMCGSCCKMSPISVLPTEEVVLREIGSRMGIEINFTHGYTIYDAHSRVNIAFSYIMHLENGKCPFLDENNRCRIHYVYKPYVCRSFPYIPRHIKYHIDDENKYIVAFADYGLSLACSVVKKDKVALERIEMLYGGPVDKILIYYYKDGYMAAREAEQVRTILLNLLSRLWREGIVDLRPGNYIAPVVNLYDFLRKYYPDLPVIVGMNKILARVRENEPGVESE